MSGPQSDEQTRRAIESWVDAIYPDDDRDEDIAAEEIARERLWHEFECCCLELAEKEPDGWSAVLRAVARAMKDQRELVPK
jgi:hypothetical protein